MERYEELIIRSIISEIFFVDYFGATSQLIVFISSHGHEDKCYLSITYGSNSMEIAR